MKKLHLTFLNSEGKKHKLVPKVAAPDLTTEQVQTAMDKFSELGIFQKGEVVLYQEKASAKYVETIETTIF